MNLPFVRDVMFTKGVELLRDDRRSRPTVRGRELPARVNQLRVADPDDGVAIGRQLSYGVCARVGDRRARDTRPAGTLSNCDASSSPAVRGRYARSTFAAERADWGSPLPEGRARGITSSGFLGHSAQVTEVSLDDRGRVHVDRIVFALDCGRNVNPDLIRAQVEGGLLWGLSAAAWGEIVLGESGEIVTQNFDRLPRHADALRPRIEVHLIEVTEPPTGVGEVSVPSVAPALANGIAALTGTRIRQLPFSNTIKIY